MKKAIAVFVVMAVLAAFADNPHITRLIELIDVAISSPADGDVLTFDAASGKWSNHPQNKPQRIESGTFFGSPANVLLFTVDETANYRVTVAGEVSFNATFQLHGPSFFNIGTISANDGRALTFAFHAAQGDPIQYDLTQSGGQANLHFTVEKL